MGKRINPAMVGAFVLGALGLILAAIILLEGGWFRKTHEYVIYFGGGGINGLRVGAPVKFKGVEIGEVKRTLLQPGAAGEPHKQHADRPGAHPGDHRAG